MSWRGEGAQRWREKRENTRRKRRVLPRCRETSNGSPSLHSSAQKREKRKKRGRASRTFASPSNHLSRRRGNDAGEALEVAEGVTRGGKREQKGSAEAIHRLANTPPCPERSGAESSDGNAPSSLPACLSLRFDSQKMALTRPSAVPGWRVPRRPPL